LRGELKVWCSVTALTSFFIIESDGHSSDFEIAFFNDVAAALQLTSAQRVD